jgi:hypothetical protein
MNEFWDRITESKRKASRERANLPIEEKLIMMERMRDRAKLIAASPLRMLHKGEAKSGNQPSS